MIDDYSREHIIKPLQKKVDTLEAIVVQLSDMIIKHYYFPKEEIQNLKYYIDQLKDNKDNQEVVKAQSKSRKRLLKNIHRK